MSNSNEKLQQIVFDFKSNIIIFLDELIEQFPNEADFIVARLLLNDSVSPEIIISTFIKEILPFKESIKERDEDFFLNSNMSLFGGLDKNKVNHFKMLWKSTVLDEDDRQIIWKWFDTFIYLAEQYQKHKIPG